MLLLIIPWIGSNSLFAQSGNRYIHLAKIFESSPDSLYYELRKMSKKINKTNLDEAEIKLVSALIKLNIDKTSSATQLFQGLEICRSHQYDTLGMYYEHYLGRVTDKNQGIEYYRRSLNTSKKLKDTFLISSNYLGLAAHYMSDLLASYSTAEKLDSILRDSCIMNFEKAAKYAYQDNDLQNVSKIYSNLSSLHLIFSDYEKSKKMIDSSMIIKNMLGDSVSLSFGYFNLGNYNYTIEDYDEALKNYNLSLDYVDKGDLDFVGTINQNLAYIYFDLKKYEVAASFFEQALNNFEAAESQTFNNKQLLNVFTDMIIDQSSQEVERKQMEATKASRRSKILLTSLIGVLLFFTILFYTYYKNTLLRRKNLELKMRTDKLENERRLQEIEQSIQDKIINAAVEAKDEERKQIAEILHNSISANLSSANLHLHALKKYKLEEYSEVNKAKNLIETAGKDLRALSHDLFSPLLMKFGLEHAVKNMCELFSNEELHIILKSNLTKSEIKLPNTIKSKAFLMIKELIQNVIKHSEANQCVITLSYNSKLLNIIVMDNGVGMNQKDVKNPHAGMGITQIFSIVRAMGGKSKVDGKKGQNSISLELPIPIHE